MHFPWKHIILEASSCLCPLMNPHCCFQLKSLSVVKKNAQKGLFPLISSPLDLCFPHLFPLSKFLTNPLNHLKSPFKPFKYSLFGLINPFPLYRYPFLAFNFIENGPKTHFSPYHRLSPSRPSPSNHFPICPRPRPSAWAPGAYHNWRFHTRPFPLINPHCCFQL